MRSIAQRFGVAFTAFALVVLTVAPGVTLAQTTVQHGIGFTKGCQSPTKIGDPMLCSYTVRNALDEAEDTLTISGLTDTVHAAGGDVNSGNILGSVQIDNFNAAGTLATPATCAAASGTGTPADPWTGVTGCTLSFSGRLNIHLFKIGR